MRGISFPNNSYIITEEKSILAAGDQEVRMALDHREVIIEVFFERYKEPKVTNIN